MITYKEIESLVRVKGRNSSLFHREGQELEFKEQFNLNDLADYFRHFAAFANNRGGYLIYGIKDTPRIRTGLSPNSIEQFEKIDSGIISGHLLETFSPYIKWEKELFEIDDVSIGVFKINANTTKPVISKKNLGKNQEIKKGEVYYRYGGRTDKIQAAELEDIINKRLEQNNQAWRDKIHKIGEAEPENVEILNTEHKFKLIEKDGSQLIVLDEELVRKLKFVKEGQFVEKDGATALKIVNDVAPIDKVQVVKRIKENLTETYPLSALELVAEVKKVYPLAKNHEVWFVINEHDIKSNPKYSAYNYRNLKQERNYQNTGELPLGTPSLYNADAVKFIAKIIKSLNNKLTTPPTA